MSLSAIPAWALGILLISVRIAMLFIATPLFGAIPIPPLARVILVVSLAAGMAGALPVPIVVPLDLPSLAMQVLHEAVVGGVVAAALFGAFAAFQFAGRLLDFQIGFGVASLVDLATRNNAPLLGTLLSMLAAVFFFAIGGHLALFRLVSQSLSTFPPGGSIASLDLGGLIAQFGLCFSFGLVLVAPVVLCLFLVDVGMAFMSRTMPQMNVFVMSMALKAMVGLAVLAIAVPFAGAAMRRLFDAMFHGLARVFL